MASSCRHFLQCSARAGPSVETSRSNGKLKVDKLQRVCARMPRHCHEAKLVPHEPLMSRPHAETPWLLDGGHHGTQLRAKLGVTCKPGPKPAKIPENLELAWTTLLQIGIPRRSSRGTRDLADSQRRPLRIRLYAKRGKPCRGAVAVCVGAYLALLSAWRSPRPCAACCAGRRIWHRPVGEGLHRHLRWHPAAATRPLCAQRRLSLRRRGRRHHIRRECSARSRREISRRHPGADLCDAVEDFRRHLRRRRWRQASCR